MRITSVLALGALSASVFGCTSPETFTAAEMLTTYEIDAAIPTTLNVTYSSGTPARTGAEIDASEITGSPLGIEALVLSYDATTDFLQISSVSEGVTSPMAMVPRHAITATKADGTVARFTPSLTDLVSVSFDMQFGETDASYSVPGCEIRIVRRIQLEALPGGEITFTISAKMTFEDLAVGDTTGVSSCPAFLAAEEGRLKNPGEDPVLTDIKSYHQLGALNEDRVDSIKTMEVRIVLMGFAGGIASSSQALSSVDAAPAEEEAKVLVNDEGAELYVTSKGLL